MNETNQEVKKYHRSVSQLKGFSKCGTAFYLERLRKADVQPRPAAWSISGSAFHEVLLDWEKSGRTLDFSEKFVEIYDRMVEEEKVRQPDLSLWMKPPRTKSTEQDIINYRKRFLERDIPNYVRRCETGDWEILEIDGEKAIELAFELDLDGVVVKGAVDQVQWWPTEGIAVLEDTKTGSPDNHEFDQRQLGLYKLAIEEIHGIGISFGEYWFTKVDRGSGRFNLDMYTREYFTEMFHRLDRMIQEQLFVPNPSKSCELCPVKPWCPEKGWLQLGEKL